MNNTVEVFNSQEVLGKDFKVYGDIDNLLFLAKDVANWIEHTHVTNMLKNVDEEEKTTCIINTCGNYKSQVVFLTEDGLYEVLMQSRKPIAKAFKKEVKRILKQIRKTGNYISDRDRLLIDLFSNDNMVVANAHKKLVELETKPLIETIETQNETIEIQKPNVEFATKIQDNNEELYDMGSVCRILKLKIGRNALFLYLRTEKVLMSSETNKNIPYQSYMDRGYFKVTLDIVNGNPFKVTKVTGKGLRWLNDKMNLGIDIDKELELENEVTDNLIDELEKEVMW